MANGLKDKLAGLEGAGTSGQQGADAAGDGGAGDEAVKTKLRQRIAELEQQTQDAIPYVNAINTLSSTTVGKQIIEKIQKGEELTKYELKVAEKVVGTGDPEGSPLTAKQLEAKLAESEQRVAETVSERMRALRDAEKSNDQLEAWANKELPGYDKVRGTKAWNGYFDATINAVRNKTIEIPVGVNPYEIILKRTYHSCVSEDPDIVKGELPSAPSEEKRLQEILAVGTKPAASKTEGSEDIMPDYYKRQLEFARAKPSGALAGLSYSNPGANKKK